MSKVKKSETIERKVKPVCIPCPNPFILEVDSKDHYYDPSEFSSNHLTTNTVHFNSNKKNKLFLHTYVWKPDHRCCQILKAHIEVKMTAISNGNSLHSSDAGNDTITLFGNGGVSIIPGEKVYSDSTFPISAGEVVIKNYVLTGSQLDWMNVSKKLSFLVQDDTAVNWIKLRLEICCLTKVKKDGKEEV